MRAQLNIEVVYAILATVMVIAAFSFMSTVYYQSVDVRTAGAGASAKALSEEVTRMLQENRRAVMGVPVQLRNGESIVGFSQGQQEVRDMCSGVTISRPDECGSHSCLCYYSGHDESSFRPGEIPSPEKCERLPLVHEIYSILPFEGSIEDFNAGGVALFKSEASQWYNALGNPRGYPSGIARGVLPDQLGSVVFQEDCSFQAQVLYGGISEPLAKPGRPWGRQNVYLERAYDAAGRVHMLITPSTEYTEERFRQDITGEDPAFYEQLLKVQSSYLICAEDGVGCFDVVKARNAYQNLRKFHPEHRIEDADMLLELAVRFDDDASAEVYYQVLNDFVIWHPNHRRTAESMYRLMLHRYDPVNIDLPRSYTAQEQADITRAIMEADRLILFVEKMQRSETALDIKLVSDEYRRHAYYIRGLYHAALGNNEKAQEDLVQYRWFDETKGDYTQDPILVVQEKMQFEMPFTRALDYILELVPEIEFSEEDFEGLEPFEA